MVWIGWTHNELYHHHHETFTRTRKHMVSLLSWWLTFLYNTEKKINLNFFWCNSYFKGIWMAERLIDDGLSIGNYLVITTSSSPAFTPLCNIWHSQTDASIHRLSLHLSPLLTHSLGLHNDRSFPHYFGPTYTTNTLRVVFLTCVRLSSTSSLSKSVNLPSSSLQMVFDQRIFWLFIWGSLFTKTWMFCTTSLQRFRKVTGLIKNSRRNRCCFENIQRL